MESNNNNKDVTVCIKDDITAVFCNIYMMTNNRKNEIPDTKISQVELGQYHAMKMPLTLAFLKFKISSSSFF